VIAITLYSRPGCHLCDEMKAVVATVVQSTPDVPVTVDEIDISSDPALESLYSLEIPVLLINGKKAAKYNITEGKLRRLLIARADRGVR
jgi:thiol-disulfide isomerase/thioredoxin